jgi:hypothetical protein
MVLILNLIQPDKDRAFDVLQMSKYVLLELVLHQYETDVSTESRMAVLLH